MGNYRGRWCLCLRELVLKSEPLMWLLFASPLLPLYQKHPRKSPTELFLASRNACPESLEPGLGLQRCTEWGCCVLNWGRKIMGQAGDSLAQMETYSWDSENQSMRIWEVLSAEQLWKGEQGTSGAGSYPAWCNNAKKETHPHVLSENILIVSVSFKGVCLTRQKVQEKKTGVDRVRCFCCIFHIKKQFDSCLPCLRASRGRQASELNLCMLAALQQVLRSFFFFFPLSSALLLFGLKYCFYEK